MIFNIQLQGEALNTILKYVGAGPHNEVRRVIDDIIAQVQAQETAAAAPAPQSDAQPAGLSD